ncbi:MAG: ABC transporter permease subunit [Candidatus Melainabacteria bacterium]|nr:ABC transporter permease subunit [Candidatus Melainabacteria bacterium]
MRDFWLVFRKELTCCGRDPDVLIYAVLLPLVLYPLSAVFVNEASLWYASMQEKNRDTIYVSGVSPLSAAIAESLRSKKHFNVIDDNPPSLPPEKARSASTDAPQSQSSTAAILPEKSAHERQNLAELKKDAVAVVSVDPERSQISIEAHETSSHLGTIADQIETEIRQARFKALKEKLVEKGVSADILNVFSVQRAGLKKPRTIGATDGELKQLFDKLIALLVTFMILMMTVIGGPASVCMMAEEHEKKTFSTTLLLPIDRFVIVIAKFLTVAVICLGGAAFNLICLALFVIFIIAGILGHGFSVAEMFNDFQHLTVHTASYYFISGAVIVSRIRQYVQLPTFNEVLLMVAFFCSTGALLSAIYLCVAGYGKTVKSAQTLVSLPMILLMTLPTIAMVPGVQFNLRTALIPIANLLIMRKFDNPPIALASIAILEPIVLVVVILFFVRRNFENQDEGRRKNKGETVKAA